MNFFTLEIKFKNTKNNYLKIINILFCNFFLYQTVIINRTQACPLKKRASLYFFPSILPHLCFLVGFLKFNSYLHYSILIYLIHIINQIT